ncbi:unnamed protein product [Cercopithifilaria johnstoni]|uniref:Uncharacterized protein n=1 Tax=Cercopithifilaria johnstoni TaxID=2874296 RepID=A0A8J2MC74_9BILA|nr:unnamed protein product [Cercopithifilaria johnstoni]
MYAKQNIKPWIEQQVSTVSATRGQHHDPSMDSMYVNICDEIKRNPDEAVKDLELRLYFNPFARITRTRERAAGNGNATTGGHRRRHRNFENGMLPTFVINVSISTVKLIPEFEFFKV